MLNKLHSFMEELDATPPQEMVETDLVRAINGLKSEFEGHLVSTVKDAMTGGDPAEMIRKISDPDLDPKSVVRDMVEANVRAILLLCRVVAMNSTYLMELAGSKEKLIEAIENTPTGTGPFNREELNETLTEAYSAPSFLNYEEQEAVHRIAEMCLNTPDWGPHGPGCECES